MSNVLHTVTVAAWTECCSAHGISNGNDMSLTTYARLPEFLEQHGHELVEGAWIVDLVPLANVEGLVRLAWKQPLPSHRVTERVENPGSMDYVPFDQWAEYWQGTDARVGRWLNGEVVWDA